MIKKQKIGNKLLIVVLSVLLVSVATGSIFLIKKRNTTNIIQSTDISGWKTYKSKSFPVSFSYPEDYFVEESEDTSYDNKVHYYVSVYSSPKAKQMPTKFIGYSFIDTSRVFHMIIEPNSQFDRIDNYLDEKPEQIKLKIGDDLWNVFKIRNKNMGDFSILELLALTSKKDGVSYTLNFLSIELDTVQQGILSSLRL